MSSKEVSGVSSIGEVSLDCEARLDLPINLCREDVSGYWRMKGDSGEDERGTLRIVFTKFRKGVVGDCTNMGEEGGSA